MLIIDWITRWFSPEAREIYLTTKQAEQEETALAIKAYSIMTAANLVAGAVSKCEFRTYCAGHEIVEDEYYLWNIEPNPNQSSSQFLQELVYKLMCYSECLVFEVNGNLYVADSFVQTKNATRENTFASVLKEDFTFEKTFFMRDVLYFSLSNSEVKHRLCSLLDTYDKLMSMAIKKYRRSGGRKGIIKLKTTSEGEETYKQKLDDLFNNRFAKYFEAENAVLPLPNSVEYDEKNGEGSRKGNNELGDITSLIKQELEMTARAYKIPPVLLCGEQADVSNATQNLLTFCIDPLCDMLSEEIIRKRYGRSAFLRGDYLDIDTTCIQHIDIFTVAEKTDKLLSSGIYSIDELRCKLRDSKLGTEWSQKHWITKNYAGIESAEGSESE